MKKPNGKPGRGRPKNPPDRVNVAMRMNCEVLAVCRQLARDEGRTITGMVEEILRNHLGMQRKERP